MPRLRPTFQGSAFRTAQAKKMSNRSGRWRSYPSPRQRGSWHSSPIRPAARAANTASVRPASSESKHDLSHHFEIYKNTVHKTPGGLLRWTIDLWVLPPTKRNQGIGTAQVRYLMQRADMGVLEVGNAVNFGFWSRFVPQEPESDRNSRAANSTERLPGDPKDRCRPKWPAALAAAGEQPGTQTPLEKWLRPGHLYKADQVSASGEKEDSDTRGYLRLYVRPSTPTSTRMA